MNRVSRSSLSTGIALLGLLHERPMHGYEIYQQLSAPSGLGLIWCVKQAQLYALLERLEAESYVTATFEPQEKAPPRKVLSLTAKGSKAYEDWVCSPVPSAREMRLEFLAKLYFIQREGPEVRRLLIDAQRRTCLVWLARLKQHAMDAATPFDMMVWRFRVSQVEAMLGWLDDCGGTISTRREK